MKLWQKIAAGLPPLDEEREWYTLADIAPLLGPIQTRSLSNHARSLWPNHCGHYRLSRAHAERLIQRVCWAGKKVARQHS